MQLLTAMRRGQKLLGFGHARCWRREVAALGGGQQVRGRYGSAVGVRKLARQFVVGELALARTGRPELRTVDGAWRLNHRYQQPVRAGNEVALGRHAVVKRAVVAGFVARDRAPKQPRADGLHYLVGTSSRRGGFGGTRHQSAERAAGRDGGGDVFGRAEQLLGGLAGHHQRPRVVGKAERRNRIGPEPDTRPARRQ